MIVSGSGFVVGRPSVGSRAGSGDPRTGSWFVWCRETLAPEAQGDQTFGETVVSSNEPVCLDPAMVYDGRFFLAGGDIDAAGSGFSPRRGEGDGVLCDLPATDGRLQRNRLCPVRD